MGTPKRVRFVALTVAAVAGFAVSAAAVAETWIPEPRSAPTSMPTTPAVEPTSMPMTPATFRPDGCEPFSLDGSWRLTDYPGRGDVGPEGQRPIQMAMTYTFSPTTYEVDAYPPLTITGSYEVVEVDGARVRLRFFDTIFNGSPRDEHEAWLTFTGCGAGFEMDERTFTRVVN